jgi:hypothetical protein
MLQICWPSRNSDLLCSRRPDTDEGRLRSSRLGAGEPGVKLVIAVAKVLLGRDLQSTRSPVRQRMIFFESKPVPFQFAKYRVNCFLQ